MIKSLNTVINVIDDDELGFNIQELEERDEMVCVGNVCVGAATPCAGQACALACFGITACAIGLHMMD